MSTFPKPASKPMPPMPGPKPGGFTNEAPAPKRTFSVSTGKMQGIGERVVIYGPGGVGKSSLIASTKTIGMKTLFIDPEGSTKSLDVSRMTPEPETWDDIRDALHSPSYLAPYDIIAIESFTLLEDWAKEWVIRNIPHEKKGIAIRGIQDYGWGKGVEHIYDTFVMLLGDLDAVTRTGKHVVATAHPCIQEVPNPGGENYIQSQPRLQSPKNTGKLRERVKEWCDHLFFIDFDKAVENHRAIGGGSRTIYCHETPGGWWAKSHILSDPIPYPKDDSTLWQQLFGKETV
jgi:hypothetical protein